MKAGEYNYGVISLMSFTAGYFAVFDLSLGTISTSPTASGLTANITDAGNGWWRCQLLLNNVTLNTSRGITISVSPNGTTSATAAGSSGIYIFGAQAENGTNATTYQTTTSLSTPLWVTSNVTTTKNQTGIDGVENAASLITATSANGTCIQYTTLAYATRTSSAYVKRVSGSGPVQFSHDGVTWTTIDLSSTDWRRVVITIALSNPSIGFRLLTNGDSIAVDFVQSETGPYGSGVTTPIYTTSSTATRATEFMNFPVLPFNTSMGSIIATGYYSNNGQLSTPPAILGIVYTHLEIYQPLI
jgi:hypothetical protein